MTDGVIVLPLAPIEGIHLGGLVGEFIALLSASTGAMEDPAVARLTPDAYPDDDEANAEFSASTHRDLLDRRMVDAQQVQTALARFAAGTSPESDDALISRDLVIRPEELDAWLRTLTAIRLVVASRLGITGEDDHDPEDERFAIYDWLGYRLDGLVTIADEQFPIRGTQHD